MSGKPSIGGDRWVAGVDGCPAGWLVALRQMSGAAPPRTRIVGTFADVLALAEGPRVIAVDMPIGLPERTGIGGRAPDIAARRVLGARQSSVFAVPSRRAVMASTYADACAIALETSDPPRKISKQAWQLFSRIREIDALMTPDMQTRVFECHPEVAFREMNGQQPLDEPKKVKSRPHAPGLQLRRDLLVRAGFPEAFLAETAFRPSAAGADDFLDACACAWTAGRILVGIAETFPPEPPLDAKGLRQEIKA
jgi:predicted RNase H-like nuclease